MEADSIFEPQTLMQRAKEGDAQAFEKLYQKYLTPVYRYIHLRVMDKDIAQDLTQTTFLKVYQSLGSYSKQHESPLPFFFTIARNTIIDHWRKRKEVRLDTNDENDPFLDIPDNTSDPAQMAEQTDSKRIVSLALQQLTPDQREIIRLKFIAELSNNEIATITGKTEEAIRQLQFRALSSLRKILKDRHYI